MVALGQRHREFHLWQMIQKQVAENPHLFIANGDDDHEDDDTHMVTTTSTTQSSVDSASALYENRPRDRNKTSSRLRNYDQPTVEHAQSWRARQSDKDVDVYRRNQYRINHDDHYGHNFNDDANVMKQVPAAASYKPYSQNAVNEQSYGHLPASTRRRHRYERTDERPTSGTYIVEPMK